MARVRLIHWNVGEARERAARLRRLGHEVETGALTPALIRAIKLAPPEAVVIDLSRLPSHGRDVGVLLREARATRRIPLLFVAGAPDKVARTRETLPDAKYVTWRGVGRALASALRHPPAAPVVPVHRLAGYSGTPLPKKLGIKAGATVLLVDAPADIAATIGDLPEGAVLKRGGRGSGDLLLWFVTRRAQLERRVTAVARRSGRDGIWIAWPKKASGVVTDVSEPIVRATGLAVGLVDFKVCAIDGTWSGLKFVWRKVAP